MLRLSPDTRVFVCARPTDMRKSFNGLFALTKTVLDQDPLSGHLFVFVNRKRDFVKALYFERGGLCLWAKRLEQGERPNQAVLRISYKGDLSGLSAKRFCHSLGVSSCTRLAGC